MEGLIRTLITVMLIGLVVMAIIFFSIFGVVPAEKITKVLKGEKSTSTEGQTIIITTTTIIEKIIEKEIEVEKEEKPFIEKYDHNLILENDQFSPLVITGEKGDVIKIGLVSVDKEYKILIPDYGLSQTVSPSNNNKLIAFQALESGEFSILCDGCREGFYGRLIINN
jgi:hypothetical protein